MGRGRQAAEDIGERERMPAPSNQTAVLVSVHVRTEVDGP